jgi:surface polysaccharide O-acyltransferase-like enzyme
MKEWISEIDGLRGVAILAVIAIHTTAHFTNIDAINGLLISNLVIDVFSHFAVPLFVFISGYVLSSKYRHVTTTYYTKRIKAVILPYILFSFFYLSCTTLFYAKLPPDAIHRLLTGGYGFLWFLILILQLYLLYPFLIIKATSYYILSSAFVAQFIWVSYAGVIIPSDLVGLVFPSHIFYFVLGIYAQKHPIKLRSSYLMLIPILTAISSYSLISLIIEYGGFYNIPKSMPFNGMIDILLFTLTIIVLSNIVFSVKLPNVLLLIGRYSFGIYLVHAFFMLAIPLLLVKASITPLQWSFYPIMFICTLTFSFGLTWIMWRLPIVSSIIGAKTFPIRSGKLAQRPDSGQQTNEKV